MLTRGVQTGQLTTSHGGLLTSRSKPDRISPCKSRRGYDWHANPEDYRTVRRAIDQLPQVVASFADRTDTGAWRQKVKDLEKVMEDALDDNPAREAPSTGSGPLGTSPWWTGAQKESQEWKGPLNSQWRGPQNGKAEKKAAGEVVVAVDVEEYPDSYSLWLDVPGLQKSDVKVQVSPSMRTMTISGDRKRPIAPEPTGRVRHERSMGSFSRTIRLAKDVDASTIAAKVDRGVLHVTAQKIPVIEPEDDSMEIPID